MGAGDRRFRDAPLDFAEEPRSLSIYDASRIVRTVARVKRADGTVVESWPDRVGEVGSETTAFRSSARDFRCPLPFLLPCHPPQRFARSFAIPFPRHIHSCNPLLPPRFHPFRRFCPPPRGTINFPALNPGRGAAATTTAITTAAIERFYNTRVYTAWERAYGLYRLRVPLFTGLTTYL